MFQERARTLRGLSAALDVACLCAAFVAAIALRIFHERIPLLRELPSIAWTSETAVRADYAVLLVTSIVTVVYAIRRARLYPVEPTLAVSRLVGRLTKAFCLAVLATGAVVFVLKMQSISRLFFAYYFASGFLLVAAKHVAGGWWYRRFHRSERGQRRALVVGAGSSAAWFAHVVHDSRDHGYRLAGIVLTRGILAVRSFAVPVLGMVKDLDQVLAQHRIDEVFVVGGPSELVGLAPIVDALIERGVVVSLVSTPATAAQGVRARVTEFSGVPMVSFGPMPRDEVQSGVKRAVDVAVAGVACLVLAPLMVAVAAAIKLVDPGPALFAQERLGSGGRTFRLYKFRSMRVDAEGVLRADAELYERYRANDFKLPDGEDPRVSRLGRFLRKTSLDELPQLFNVIRGDMTLVGPRPIVPEEIDRYAPYDKIFLSARPGITGAWQVSGRSRLRYPERAFVDLDYVGSRTLASDLSIIARTVPAVLRGKGA